MYLMKYIKLHVFYEISNIMGVTIVTGLVGNIITMCVLHCYSSDMCDHAEEWGGAAYC